MAKPSTPIKKNGNGDGQHDIPPQPRVYFAVLHDRLTHWRALRSIIRVAMWAGASGCVNLTCDHKRTDMTRDELIALFRHDAKQPYDVLVMLDNDHEFPNPQIVNMLAASPYGVTGALAFRRGNPFDPIMFLRCADDKLHPITLWEQNTIVECHMVGHGAIAIKRHVFDDLEAAGFKAPFYRYTYPDGGARPSEDMYFGQCCETAKISHWCDTRLIIPHLSETAIDGSQWQQWLTEHPGSAIDSSTLAEPTPRMRVSVIIPSRGRPEQIRKCVDRLFATTQGHDVECIVVTDDGSSLAGSGASVIEGEYLPIAGWNLGAQQASGDAFVLGADDLWWGDGWLEAALRGLLQLPEHSGLVGFNTLEPHRDFATHYLMTRDFAIRFNGGVLACPAYHSYYIDPEANARAQAAGRYYYAENSIVEHRHPLWNKAEMDETYQLSLPYHEADQAVYLARRAQNFPNDFEPVLSEVKAMPA